MECDLKNLYLKDVVPAMMKGRSYQNIHQVPKLEKIVVNCSTGSAQDVKAALEDAIHDMTLIAGQKPVKTRSKKSISNFKLRLHQEIGCKVTLRRAKMYEFLDRLINISLPRVRDFRGVKGTSFDGRGNYAMGLKEHIVFPEINFDKVDEVLGMDIIICTTAKTDAEAKALLKHFNMPFTS